MKRFRLSRWYLWVCLPMLLALVGLVWGRPLMGGKFGFNQDDLKGRYVSAETAYDVSTFHPASSGDYVAPVPFATTSVMLADGNGNVCGSADGFYGGTPPPGVNLGQQYFHGTYAIDTTGRITITICSDTGFCATTGPCSASDTTTAEQVGYLQSPAGNTVTTVDQVIPVNPSSGFLVHSRVWIKDALFETLPPIPAPPLPN